MDITSWFCGAAAFVLAGLWTFKTGNWPRSLGALGGGAVLYLLAPPAVCAVALLGCCLVLILVLVRDPGTRVELLQTRAVLITGCDSGIGLAVATRLSQLGLKVFAGVLDLDGAGAHQLRGPGSENLQVLQLDVTDGSQVEAAHRFIRTQVGDTGLWGLVNNAGVLLCPADAELQPMAAYRVCMDVNFLSAVRTSQLFLPLLRRSRGRLVNMSSMAGQVPMPRFAAYGASKAALSVFTEVMRMELSSWGVRVALIQPTGFRTNIFGSSADADRFRDQILAAASSEAREDYGDAYISSLPDGLSRMSRQSAVDLSPVVDAVCHALLAVRPKAVYTPGQMGRLLPLLHRHCPTAAFDAVITAVTRHGDCRPAGLTRS